MSRLGAGGSVDCALCGEQSVKEGIALLCMALFHLGEQMGVCVALLRTHVTEAVMIENRWVPGMV